VVGLSRTPGGDAFMLRIKAPAQAHRCEFREIGVAADAFAEGPSTAVFAIATPI